MTLSLGEGVCVCLDAAECGEIVAMETQTLPLLKRLPSWSWAVKVKSELRPYVLYLSVLYEITEAL